MTDIAKVGLEADSSQIAAATANLNKMADAAKRAAVATDAQAKSSHNAQASTVGHANSLKASAANAVTAIPGLGGLARAFSAVGAAGLAMTVAVAALYKARDAANALADKAGRMVDFAETTNLTTAALQSLERAGSQVGVKSEKIGTSFERFSIQIEELRRGTGGLFEAMDRLSPGLSEQMARTRDTAEAWDLLSRATRSASTEQTNAASRAAFGRGGVAMTRLMGETDRVGGMNDLIALQVKSDMLADEQLRKWDELKDRSDLAGRTARDNIASIFAEKILNLQLAFNLGFLEFSREAKNFFISDSLKKYLNFLGAKDFESAKKALKPTEKPATFDERFPPEFIPMPRSRPVELSEEFQIAKLKRTIAVMGEAATVADKYELGLRLLAEAKRLNAVTDEQYAASQKVLNESLKSTAINSRIGLMGEMTKAQEIALQIQYAINKANRDGAKITIDEATAIKEKNVRLFEQSRLENQLAFERSQLGLGDVDAAVAARLRSAGRAGDDAAGAVIRLNKQLEISKDLTQDFASGFAQDMMRGATAAQSMNNALGRLQSRLMDMIINNLVSRAFSGSGGGFMSLLGNIFGGGGSNAGNVGGAGSDVAGSFIGNASTGFMAGARHSGGMVDHTGPKRYIHPAYFDNAQRFHGGGLAGNEVPIIAQKGEGVFTSAQMAAMGGGGSNVQINVINNADGTKVETKQRDEGGTTIHDIIVSTINEQAANGGMDATMRSRYGIPVRGKSR